MVVNILLFVFGTVLGAAGMLVYFRGRKWYTIRQNTRAMRARWKSNLGNVAQSKSVGRFSESNRTN